jgi:ketosteroid isomerase-like protein
MYVRAQVPAEKQIRQILQAQEAAWNRGDLRAFMKGYWEHDSLVFIGRNGPVYGYKTTLANYLRSYPDTAHMGHFTSTVLELRPMGKEYYLVTGKWALQRSMGNVSGYYTLLFRKIKGIWLIIRDHTS